MKFNEKYDINPEFDGLFDFKNKEQELKHEAAMVMFRFLSEIERITEGKLTKKELAKTIGTSASYITQLYNGDKLINLQTIAKLQDAFNIIFDIKAIPGTANNFEVDMPVTHSDKHFSYDKISGEIKNVDLFEVVKGGRYPLNRA